jgi:hypothetical protein
MSLVVGFESWARSLAERLVGVAAESTVRGRLAESWDMFEEELPNDGVGAGGGMDECLQDLLRDLGIGGTTLAARQGRRRPRSMSMKRGTLGGVWMGSGGNGRWGDRKSTRLNSSHVSEPL